MDALALLTNLAMNIVTPAYASYPVPAALEQEFNQGSPAMQRHQLGTKLVKGLKQAVKAQYSFAVLGGDLAQKDLLGPDGKPAIVPQGAVIDYCVIDNLTAATSANSTATIALGLNTDVDIKAATAISSYTGLLAAIPVGTVGSSIKTTVDRTFRIKIGTEPLTAGKFNLYCEYYLSNN